MDNFENFQLYRTNILLGGNMKYDLILDDNGEDLYVKDFHITNLCGREAVTLDIEEYLLKNKHQDNIKKHHDSILGTFYNDQSDPYINTEWPLVYQYANMIKTYDDNAFMGCVRPKQFTRYNKQFEFLVPLWIEQYGDIKFVIELYGNNNLDSKLITSKVLNISNINEKLPKFHNDFCRYMNKYTEEIGLKSYERVTTEVKDGKLNKIRETVYGGSNEVMKIDFTDGLTYLHGLNISTGKVDNQAIYDLAFNLMHRETPVYDFNKKIIDSFPKYKYIAKQLFNFNLCFNIQDIASRTVYNSLLYNTINIKVKVYINNRLLSVKDMLSNYDQIDKINICPGKLNQDSSIDKPNKNVFEFLKDHKIIDFKYTNKITQPVIFWSLADNSDYIFNLYEGFAGYSYGFGSESQPSDTYHLYKDSFDPNVSIYNKYLNNAFWANVMELDQKDLYKLINEYYRFKHLYSPIKHWLKHTKYNLNPEECKNIEYILLIKYIDEGELSNLSILNDAVKMNGNKFVIKKMGKTIFLLSKNEKELTFANVKSSLKEYIKSEDYKADPQANKHKALNELCEYMESLIQPKTIYFKAGVGYQFADGPTKDVKEMEYYKNDNYDNHLLRYDGYIKPTFIDKYEKTNEYKNNFYYKDVIRSLSTNDNSSLNNDFITSTYSLYADSGYSPKFPSIKYYSLKNIELNHEQYPFKKSSIDEDPYLDANGNIYEYKWFNHGRVLVLPQQINDIYTYKRPVDDEVYLDLDNYSIMVEYLSNFLPKSIIDNSTTLIISNTSTIDGEEITQISKIPLVIVRIMELYHKNISIISSDEKNNTIQFKIDLILK